MADDDGDNDEIVGKAMEGSSPHAKHTHPVVLVGKFKKEESREPEHKQGKRKEERKERERY